MQQTEGKSSGPKTARHHALHRKKQQRDCNKQSAANRMQPECMHTSYDGLLLDIMLQQARSNATAQIVGSAAQACPPLPAKLPLSNTQHPIATLLEQHMPADLLHRAADHANSTAPSPGRQL